MSGYFWGSQGKAIQIVAKNEKTGSFEVASKTVEKLLGDDKVKDKKVCVISVAGAFRKGKSFLLNFFVKYLEKACERVDDLHNWLGSNEDDIAGFVWRGGSERETTGIWAWSKVFILKKMVEGTNVDAGFSTVTSEEIAVVLLDTQGTFDSDSSTNECIAVFALATLISSTLVFNLSQNIQENDLQHLQLFAEYGRQAQAETVRTDIPFQSLMFLVRDWPNPDEHDYGLDGGRNFLQKKLAISGKHSDLTDVRQGIQDCFSDLHCCLLPYPGSKVATNRGSTRKLSDVDEEFRNHVKKFVESTASFDRLVKKKINGQEMTCGKLVTFLNSYVEAFQGEGSPSATTLLQTTAKAHHLVALEHAKTQFMTHVKKVCGAEVSYMDPNELDLKLKDIRSDAEGTFKAYRKVGSRVMNEEYLGMLSNYMMETCKEYTQMNRNKANFFVKTMAVISYIFFPFTSTVAFLKIHGWFHRSGMKISSFARSFVDSIEKLWSGITTSIENSRWMPSLPDLDIQNRVRNVVRAPLTLIFIMVIFNLLSSFFRWFGLSEFSTSLNYVVMAAFIMLCLWIYLAFSGNLPGLRQAIDTIAASIWQSSPGPQPVQHHSRQSHEQDGNGHGERAEPNRHARRHGREHTD